MAAVPAVFGLPKPWTNQNVLLYHGTLDVHVASIRAGVNPALGRAATDFGRGFYTTTVERQARSWAFGLSRRRAGTRPAVVRFDVPRDDLAGLESIWFVRGSPDAEDFWSLVVYCRTGGVAHARAKAAGWYDVAVGPIAAAWKRRLLKADADQISFHTTAAAKVLDLSRKDATVLDAGVWRNYP
jgi:hypothetical protein